MINITRPVLVIELDDSSHKKSSATKNDRFKDELFANVGLRCVRITAARAYNIEEVKQKLTPPFDRSNS